MIREAEIVAIGAFAKPHGIKGELNAEFDYDVDVRSFKCLIVDVDGIYVPFFIDGVRPRGIHSALIHIDGVNDERSAKAFSGKEIYVLRSEADFIVTEEDCDGLYASDLIGYTINDDAGEEIGVIDGYDDSTDNVLFIVSRKGSDASPLYIPVADDFITDIDTDKKVITMSLPEGLVEL